MVDHGGLDVNGRILEVFGRTDYALRVNAEELPNLSPKSLALVRSIDLNASTSHSVEWNYRPYWTFIECLLRSKADVRAEGSYVRFVPRVCKNVIL